MSYSQFEIEEALKRRDMSILTTMINDGMNVNDLVVDKHTDILLAAISKEHKPLFNLVLSKGFNCNNKNGFLYMHHAVRTHDLFFISSILNHYIAVDRNYNEVNGEKENCLHIAAAEEGMPIQVFDYLDDIGIRWDETNVYGQTPLHILLRNNEVITDELLVLIEKHVDAFDLKDDFGISCIDIVNSASYSEDWLNNNQKLYDLVKKIQKTGNKNAIK